MKRNIVLSAVLMLGAAAVQAAGVGTTGAQFLEVGVGARELALGSAASVLTSGANAINWNPARLAGLSSRSLSASYNSLFLDESQGFLGYAAPLGNDMGVLAGGVNYLTVSDIYKRAGDTENPDSTFSDNNTALTLSYAKSEVRPGLSLGASLKYVQQGLDGQNDRAMALDAGSVLKLGGTWTAALAVQNLGGKIGPDDLPLTVRGGAAASLLAGKLSAAADVDWLANDKLAYLSVGAEYSLARYLAVRAGYQFGRSQDKLGGLTGLAAGMGLKFGEFSLDYAYVPFGDLGDTHRMTMGLNF